MLVLKKFSKQYAKNPNYSAKDVSFTVSAGEVVGLVGSNGAGKSTIIKSIIGVLPFREGTITVGGYDINRQPEKAKRLIGYVPDDHTVYEKLTGREYINYMGSLYGATEQQKKYAAGELAEHFGIRYALDTQIASYSHGMRQKICILGALVHRPRLWILDEPMVGLDHQTMMLLCNYIREYADDKHAVLFSSHNLDVVRKVCDKVVFIRKGRIADIVDLRVEKNFSLDKYYMELNGMQEEAGQFAPQPAPYALPQGGYPAPWNGAAYPFAMPSPPPVYPVMYPPMYPSAPTQSAASAEEGPSTGDETVSGGDKPVSATDAKKGKKHAGKKEGTRHV